jgi:hypothetical protein
MAKLRSLRPFRLLFVLGNKKGAQEPLFSRTAASWVGLSTYGDAPSYDKQ